MAVVTCLLSSVVIFTHPTNHGEITAGPTHHRIMTAVRPRPTCPSYLRTYRAQDAEVRLPPWQAPPVRAAQQVLHRVRQPLSHRQLNFPLAEAVARGRVDPYQHRRTSVDDGPSCTPVRSAAGCGTNRGREAVCRAATGRSIVAGTSEYGAGSTLSGTGAAAATARRAISGGAVPCKHRAARPHPLRASPNRACSDAEATGTGGPSSRCTSVGTSSKMRPVALRTPRILRPVERDVLACGSARDFGQL